MLAIRGGICSKLMSLVSQKGKIVHTMLTYLRASHLHLPRINMIITLYFSFLTRL